MRDPPCRSEHAEQVLSRKQVERTRSDDLVDAVVSTWAGAPGSVGVPPRRIGSSVELEPGGGGSEKEREKKRQSLSSSAFVQRGEGTDRLSTGLSLNTVPLQVVQCSRRTYAFANLAQHPVGQTKFMSAPRTASMTDLTPLPSPV